jgi:16S rRNA (uracil1498-N3)-methyltransferase
MPRIYLPSILAGKPDVKITGENARYLLSVLRCRVGDKLIVFDSEGCHYKAEIIKTGKNNLYIELKETLPPVPEPKTGIILLQGILKGQKMDMVIQKATELGVKEIVPLITERTQIKETRKLQRWQKIAVEAARQSGRGMVPEVQKPVEVQKFFDSENAFTGFIFWEEGGVSLRDRTISCSDKPIVVAVGPEGGFTEEEVRLAEKKGLIVATLGNRILRAETAAISAITLIQFLLGEMG